MPVPSPTLPLCVACIALATSVFAQPRPEYGIKEDQPRTGSHIRRHAVKPTQIPVNLPYHQLTAEDKAWVHAPYERIAPGDEPPFPTDGLRSVLDPIRRAQGKLLVQGDLFLIATIGPDGKAREVKAMGSPSPEMTRIAAQILMVTAYKPAMCGGQPCTMDFPLRMSFSVR